MVQADSGVATFVSSPTVVVQRSAMGISASKPSEEELRTLKDDIEACCREVAEALKRADVARYQNASKREIQKENSKKCSIRVVLTENHWFFLVVNVGNKIALETEWDTEALLLCAGAGFSADSGLPTYEEIANVKAYQEPACFAVLGQNLGQI